MQSFYKNWKKLILINVVDTECMHFYMFLQSECQISFQVTKNQKLSLKLSRSVSVCVIIADIINFT